MRDLDIEHFDADSVTLVWTKPAHEGNRDDLFYTVRCERCSSSVIYTPAKTNLQTTKVTLTNLAPLTSYTVEIIAENGVSAVDPRFTKSDSKSFKTLASDSETQAEIQAVCDNSVPLSVPLNVLSQWGSFSVTKTWWQVIGFVLKSRCQNDVYYINGTMLCHVLIDLIS